MKRAWSLAVAMTALLANESRCDDEAVVWANLNDVRAQPRAYLKTTFEFEGRFSNHGEIFQPFFTMFDDYMHTNFAAWDVNNDLGEREQYLDKCSLLYVDRDSQYAIENLFSLNKYQRFRATAMVQSIFADRAFIEVFDVVPLDGDFEPGAHGGAALASAAANSTADTSIHSSEQLAAVPADEVQLIAETTVATEAVEAVKATGDAPCCSKDDADGEECHDEVMEVPAETSPADTSPADRPD